MANTAGQKPCILPIVFWPDKRLSAKCEDVSPEEFNLPDIDVFISSMVLTMQAHDGIGLAAPQVGILKNIIAIQLPDEIFRVFVNPKITNSNFDFGFTWEEGCLSVPGYFENRVRDNRIDLEYVNHRGVVCQAQFSELTAFVIQHELDHLTGGMFIDDLSPLKKDRIKKKIRNTLNRRR